MGRNGKWKWDAPSGSFLSVCIISAAFLLGGVAGRVIAGLIEGDSGEMLSTYLTTYLTMVGEDSVHIQFWAVLWEQLRFPLLVFVLGFTALGAVGIPVLFGVRGFLFSFCVACFFRMLGTQGWLPAFFLFGLPALLWAPALFILGAQGMQGSSALLRRALGERVSLPYDGGYLLRSGLCGLAVALCVAVEYLAVPALLRAAVRVMLQ